jgi:hypothetical protein
MDPQEAALQGLWVAWPEGTDRDGRSWSGLCLVALRDGSLLGGDAQYHFGGRYWFEGQRLMVRLESQNYAGAPFSIWGFRDGAEIELSGNFPAEPLVLGGHAIGDNTSDETRVILQRLRSWPGGQ